MGEAPRLVVREIECGVRPVHLRLPFRFGNTTLTTCPQIFVCATVEVAGHGIAEGRSAEMMVPGWFDKSPARSPRENVADLAESIRAASHAYTGREPCSAFELFARNHGHLVRHGQNQRWAPLSTGFGAAALDRAVIDAMCQAIGATFFEAVQRNAFGIGNFGIAADMRGFDWNLWLASLKPMQTIRARHTVGILDEVEVSRFAADGLPASLPAAIERYGHHDFKIKLGGDVERDLERLSLILGVLEKLVPDFRFTLDGNEQFKSRNELDLFIAKASELATLRRRPDALLYLEQPVPREVSFDEPVSATPHMPWLLDEADESIDAFPKGRSLGWRGVSSKGCKGIYKSFLNRARCDVWNAESGELRFFMSAEDLCCQAGIGVQQDLAIASALGLDNAERNGHHYVDGMQGLSGAEQERFGAAHPDLYESACGHVRLRIKDGSMSMQSLIARNGFAHPASQNGSIGLVPLERCTEMV